MLFCSYSRRNYESSKKVLLTIVGVLYFAFALCMTILLLNYNKYGITQFGETSLIIIKEDVSFDGYKKVIWYWLKILR